MGWVEWIAGYIFRGILFIPPILGSLHVIVFALARRRWGLLAFGLGLLAFLALVYQPLVASLPGVSVDSFREATSFDLQEAAFYLRTLLSIAYVALDRQTLTVWAIMFAIYAVLFVVFSKLARSIFAWATPGLLTAIAVIALILPPTVYAAIKAWRGYAEANGQIEQAKRNFSGDPAQLDVTDDPSRDLAILLYIGESSSRLHWSLYGYPRQTTPDLDKLYRRGDLVAFDHVTSTFPYTSNSLLEALSIAQDPARSASGLVPIFEQRRYAIVDVLAQAGVTTSVYSNQARFGSWNLASEMIFRNAKERKFSTDRMLGNLDFLDDDRPFDDQYLRQFLTAVGSIEDKTNRLLVFHSYAGHGQYQDFVPREKQRPVDGYYRDVSTRALFGSAPEAGTRENLEAYDAAMRYVSANVARTIAAVDRMSRPMALVYFSDHGDSVFTYRGHDAARYTWAMGAVPFLVYFNPAAKRKYPQLVDKYRRLAAARADESLANVPSLLFDLLGISVRQRDGILHPVGACEFGSGNCLPPYLVVQRLPDGKLTYVASPSAPPSAPPGATDVTGRATAQYNIARSLEGKDGAPQVCIHRNNSLARVIRARALTDCIELDVVVGENGRIDVYHPPAPDVGLTLSKALDAIGERPTTVWLDAKNIDSAANCLSLARMVTARAGKTSRFFVEFPSTSVSRLSELRSCVAALEQAGAYRSFYVPTKLATKCAGEQEGSRSCRQLESLLARVTASGEFSDLSFDYGALSALARSSSAKGLQWNVWYIPDREILVQTSGKFRLAIPHSGFLNFE